MARPKKISQKKVDATWRHIRDILDCRDAPLSPERRERFERIELDLIALGGMLTPPETGSLFAMRAAHSQLETTDPEENPHEG